MTSFRDAKLSSCVSSLASELAERILSLASEFFLLFLAAMMTDAPAVARARTVSSPNPPEAPVTRTFLPDKSTPSRISFVVVSLFHLLKAFLLNNQ